MKAPFMTALTTGALAGASPVALAAESAVAESAARPNFVIIVADDAAWNDFGAYGHPHIRTPHVDRLATEGMRFTSAFLTASQCSPTRASVLTGRYPHSTGAGDLHDPLPAGQVTVPELLSEAGYFTASAGKWHLGEPTKAKFDRVENARWTGDKYAEKGLDILRERPEEQPFFLWLASWDPHWPYGGDGVERRHSPDDAVVPPFIPDTPGVRTDLSMYYDEIARLDDFVGRVYAELERQGVLDNTFILFFSDNGRPFPRCKSFLYDSGIKMPFIVRYPPRAKPNSTCDGLTSAVDIAPTILELAGVRTPRTVQGQSLLPLFADPATPGREAAFAEHNWHAYQAHERCVRTRDFLYIRNAFPDLPGMVSRDYLHYSKGWPEIVKQHEQGKLDPKFDFYFDTERPAEELYDLSKDPHQMTNVIADPAYAEAANDMRARLDHWIEETNDQVPENPKKDMFDRWTGEKL